jgi:hypothetical protein
MRRPCPKRAIGCGTKAEELRTNADIIRAEECHRISLEFAATAEALADQWDAIELTMAGYLNRRRQNN